MPFYFKIYAKTDCDYCLESIKILNDAGYDYVLILLDRSPDYHNKLKKDYDWPTVPIILKGDKVSHSYDLIGGCDDLKNWLKQFSGE
tara:strand:+ start:22690 stop:22950 length:261 start_codon:yes stop_codon:yes gene_type:complete